MGPFTVVQSERWLVAWKRHAGEVENSEWIHKLFLNSGNFSCFPVKSTMHFKEYLLSILTQYLNNKDHLDHKSTKKSSFIQLAMFF